MIKRPLCMVCLLFLIVQSIIFIVRGGQTPMEEPASSILQMKENQELTVTGQVYNKKQTSNTQILYLKNNLIVYDSNFTKIKIGQYITVKGTVHHFDKAHNPGNFDQSEYYAKENIFGAIFCEQILEVSGEEDLLEERLYQVKQNWKKQLILFMGEENGQVMSAMLLGEKSEMDANIKELYQKNGIGHVLAISGLHISFVGLVIYKLIRKTGIPFLIAGFIALSLLTMYGIMIGFTVSVFRAYLMLVLKIVADITGRVYDMMTAVMLSAAITVWRQSLYLSDAGFYLSYGAVLGILLIMPILKESFLGKKRWFQLLMPGICVNVALFPIQLLYYYEFPLYSILLNLLVVPLMSLLLGFGMFGSIVSIFARVFGRICFYPCRWILVFYELLSKWGLKLPAARIVTGQPIWWKVVLYYIVLIVIIWKGINWKKIVLYFVCILSLIIVPNWKLQITMLDVGQGDCIFIKAPGNHTYLIDGGSSDVKEVGKYRMEPFLKFQGAGTLDYIFVSHGDGDHYSGIMELLQRQELGIKIQNLIVPVNYKEDENLLTLIQTAKENGVNVFAMKPGTVVKNRNVNFTCLQPTESETAGNASSMVLELSYKKFQMLFTGDVEKEGENSLISKVNGKSYTALKVSHHGSKYSTSENFLKAIDVKVALISAGENNAYGHPHEETIERLTEEGATIYETSNNGAITITSNGDKMGITVFH